MINSTAYYNDFWNEMRGKQAVTDSLYNNRESKTNAYHLPGESNKKYMAVLQKESAVRQLATVVNATRSDSRLWTFDCEGQAEWGDMVNLEGMDNEDDFQRFEVQAYRLSELVRLGLEFASDQSFAIEHVKIPTSYDHVYADDLGNVYVSNGTDQPAGTTQLYPN